MKEHLPQPPATCSLHQRSQHARSHTLPAVGTQNRQTSNFSFGSEATRSHRLTLFTQRQSMQAFLVFPIPVDLRWNILFITEDCIAYRANLRLRL